MKRKMVLIETILSILGVFCTFCSSAGWLSLSLSGITHYNLQLPPPGFLTILVSFLWSLIPAISWFLIRWLFYRRGIITEKFRMVTNILSGGYAVLWIVRYAAGIVQDAQYWYIYLESIIAILCFPAGIFLDVMLTRRFVPSYGE